MDKNIAILFRKSLAEEEELDFCKKYFPSSTYEYRSRMVDDAVHSLLPTVAVGRYSVLPYYTELERDLKEFNIELINSFDQHNYVANIENWYDDLIDLTPTTWFFWGGLPTEGSYVVKGKVNSRKHEWNTRMFAGTRDEVPEVVSSLLDDCLIAEQGVCVRRYVPLEKIDEGINGLPITKEWRFFVLNNEILCYGYYWSIIEEERWPKAEVESIELVKKVIKRVGNKSNFYVVDVAKTASGDWIVIELNDGQMAGLSTIGKDTFYKRLAQGLMPSSAIW